MNSKKTALVIFVLLLILPLTSVSQDYLRKGYNAEKKGNYKSATEYYLKAYELKPTTDLHEKIIFVHSLEQEFFAFEEALNDNNFEFAEACLENIIIIDPTNEFINDKQQEIKSKKKQNKKSTKQYNHANFNNNLDDFSDIFKGDDDKHDFFGGFHYIIGGTYIDATMLTNNDLDKGGGLMYGIYYNNSKKIPINIAFQMNSNEIVQTMNFSVFSNLFFANNFSFDYGVGYKFGEYTLTGKNINTSQPFFKIGSTISIKGDTWGGFSYYFERSFVKNEPFVHYFSYNLGRLPTLYISAFFAVITFLLLAGTILGSL